MRKLLAYCTSRSCSEIRYENRSNYAVKDVPKTATQCPQCKSALLWRKENSRNIVKDIVFLRNKPKEKENGQVKIS
jgi:uncharacterized C2H2 Zn-finger protein